MRMNHQIHEMCVCVCVCVCVCGCVCVCARARAVCSQALVALFFVRSLILASEHRPAASWSSGRTTDRHRHVNHSAGCHFCFRLCLLRFSRTHAFAFLPPCLLSCLPSRLMHEGCDYNSRWCTCQTKGFACSSNSNKQTNKTRAVMANNRVFKPVPFQQSIYKSAVPSSSRTLLLHFALSFTSPCPPLLRSLTPQQCRHRRRHRRRL